ncbi:MAG: hypothetical protein ACJAR2_003124 [Ilumatobacter sp.]|jgi:hypothetical protein
MAHESMFDRIVIVDWSANSTPKTGRDSIWIADHSVRDGSVRSANISTRLAAVDLLAELGQSPGRCLIGVDFSLGFPAGTAEALLLDGGPREAIWAELVTLISDDDRNRNNRFGVASELNARVSPGPGPFWGCPPSKATDFLTRAKVPCEPLPEWRAVEAQLRSVGRRPFSAWQLLGVGAVGSQSLVGIPAVSALVDRVRRAGRTIDVWPFTCGLSVPTADVVIAEVWPTLIDISEAVNDLGDSRVRDQVQVEALAAHLAAGDLRAMFTPEVPEHARDVVVSEEGWVLGA